MMRLWPRLSSHDALAIWDELRGKPVSALQESAAFDHDYATFTATGGVRMTGDELRSLRSKLLGAATTAGFPNPSDTNSRRTFDQDAMVILHGDSEIPHEEAAKEGMWSFMALVLLPDVAVWRYPDTSTSERFIGNAALRNVFQRLWWRADVFRMEDQEDPYSIPASLREDAAVQILERPGLAINRRLARSIATILTGLEAELPKSVSAEAFWRDVVKWIRQQMPVVDVSIMRDEELDRMVSQASRAVLEERLH